MRICSYFRIIPSSSPLCVSMLRCLAPSHDTASHGCFLLVLSSSTFSSIHSSSPPLSPLPLSDSIGLSLSLLSSGLKYPKRELRSFNVILISLTARQDKEPSQQAAQGMGRRIGRDCVCVYEREPVCMHFCMCPQISLKVDFFQPGWCVTAPRPKMKITKYRICKVSQKCDLYVMVWQSCSGGLIRFRKRSLFGFKCLKSQTAFIIMATVNSILISILFAWYHYENEESCWSWLAYY